MEHPDDLARHAGDAVPAQVPGNVELDLQRAGRIADPFYADNIHALRPYELYEWWYERTFTPPEVAEQRSDLVFHGVDCIATYWLNGEMLGTSENMFIEHR